jgi:large subunit ribosomal protein L15
MKHIGNIQLPKGAIGKKKRIGRGQGSGKGGTATRGHKGQMSRSGARIPAFFEGGQMPLSRRVPKFGFTNPFRIEYQVVNTGRLQELFEQNAFEGNLVNKEILLKLKAIRNSRKPLKILGNGELKAALEITADAFTETAKSKIESNGGKVVVNG